MAPFSSLFEIVNALKFDANGKAVILNFRQAKTRHAHAPITSI
jgi:hypothetical protein